MDEEDTAVAPESKTSIDLEEEEDEQVKELTPFDSDEPSVVNFSNTLSYELYKLKDPFMKCILYDKPTIFSRVVSTQSTDAGKEKLIEIIPEEVVEVPKKQLKDVRALYDSLASEKRKFLEKIYTIKKPKDDVTRWIHKSDSDTQTDSYSCTCSSDAMLLEKRKLEYLMGITGVDEFQLPERKPDLEEIIYEEPFEEILTGATAAMRQAQKYLRMHRIFEFFQFLITHLLSKTPENPIEFLTSLLDTCLVYRGGFTHPPLLYQKSHLDCLFNLMDPMRIGFIEIDQYKTAMHTLGVCLYNEKPPLNADGMVGKEFFLEEAYDSLTNLLNDMLRRRWIRPMPSKEIKTPPPTLVTVTRSTQDTTRSCASMGQ